VWEYERGGAGILPGEQLEEAGRPGTDPGGPRAQNGSRGQNSGHVSYCEMPQPCWKHVPSHV
jgi:hypothetical protein